MPSEAADAVGAPTEGAARSGARSRLTSIDTLRGLVMLLMLLDHTLEFFYLGHQVTDPIDMAATTNALAATRIASHLCAPVFVALTGLAAWLYGAGRSRADTSAFLLKRGAFLVVLELTVVSFAWTFAVPPAMLALQVIWAIGLSMIALAGIIWLPRAAIIAVGAVIVLGHNLLDPIHIPPGQPGHTLWAVLHDRGYLDIAPGVRARTSYPVLPWIGVIALGYGIGPWFAAASRMAERRRRLLLTGAGLLSLFAVLRLANSYGEPVAWAVQADAIGSALAVVNLTKYPPSLDFLLVTLGIGAVLLAAFEGVQGRWLAVLGAAPLFFYVVHLYLLHLLHLVVASAVGDAAYDVPSVAWVWLIAVMLVPPLWLATRWFGGVKRRSERWWVRYL